MVYKERKVNRRWKRKKKIIITIILIIYICISILINMTELTKRESGV